MNNKCPKCGTKLSPLYMKENCPNCNVNLLYYNLDQRLMEDEIQARREAEAVEKFVNIIKSSSVATPLLLIRLIFFFLPLAPMCLPMYGDISLLKVIMGIFNGGFDIGASIMPIISMGLVVVISIVVIISSLFSSTKSGLMRNMIFSAVNLVVFIGLGVYIGSMGIGWYICLAMLIIEIGLHIICDKQIKKNA